MPTEYYKRNRIFSLLGQRGTFGTVLKDLAEENNRILALSADLTRTSGLEQFAESYPDRLLNVGIAEENAIGMAAGLADRGYIPFVSTFANFAALRGNEFVRHFMAYMNCNIKLIGLGSGFAMELFGTTHYGLEDISVLRAMPNIMILSPADGLEVAKIIDFASRNAGPMYVRLSGKMNNPIVHRADFDFVPGKAYQLTDGEDAVIYATGSMVFTAVEVSRKLEQKGIRAAVFDVHTIKPLDETTVLEHKDSPMIVTIEEHAVIGGLGSAVAETLSAQGSHGRLLRFGTGNQYAAAGDYRYMLQVHGLTPEKISQTIETKLLMKENNQNDES